MENDGKNDPRKPSPLMMMVIRSGVGSRWYGHQPCRIIDLINDANQYGMDTRFVGEALYLLHRDGLIESPDFPIGQLHDSVAARNIPTHRLDATIRPTEPLQRETNAAINGSMLPFTPIGEETEDELKQHEAHMTEAINNPDADPGDPMRDIWYPQYREPPHAPIR